jgi:hypothetical protein
MDQMRVKAAFTIIHDIEGHHQTFSPPSVVTTRQILPRKVCISYVS